MTIEISVLENGLRIATDAMDTVESATIGIWVGIGARHEHPELNGVSHMLEHMAFKGTKRRSALDIAEEIEAVGGHINAYTSREGTAYYAKVLKEDVPLAADIISDILQNSTMDPEELERERAVILQEIHQAQDTPDDVVFDYFQEAAYPDQPLGRPILGDADTVSRMKRETLISYMSENYKAPQMVFSAAGRITHDTLKNLATDSCSGLQTGDDSTNEGARYTGGEKVVSKDLEQAHVLLGFEGVSYDDDDFYTASVLSTLFGGGMSSRLFQEVREKRGLAYSIYSFVPSYRDSGMFGIYAGTGSEETAELMPLLCDEVLKVQDGVKEDEVARARAQLKASILMSLESSSSRCEQLARQIQVFGRPLSTEEIVENVEAVDVEAVERTARRIFATPPTLAALGPVAKLGGLERVESHL